jgi:hypothetical protein
MEKVTYEICQKVVLKIFIDGQLHLLLNGDSVNGIYSWIDTNDKFFIKICFKQGQELLLEYVKRHLWDEVLRCINNAF